MVKQLFPRFQGIQKQHIRKLQRTVMMKYCCYTKAVITPVTEYYKS